MNLFVANINPQRYAAIEAVSGLAGLSKKAVIEAMIADKMGETHPELSRVRSAWTRYRKGERS